MAAVALKGSSLRPLSLYQPGERPMGDVDLLVRPVDAAACAAIMPSLGYSLLYTSRRHAVFAQNGRTTPCSFGEHRDLPLKIEIHTSIYEELPLRRLEITEGIWPTEPRAGLNSYATPAARLRHVMLHAANSMRSHAARFIQVHDIARLSSLMSDCDWQQLLSDDASSWWMYPPLNLAARYVPHSVPSTILALARARSPRWLRARFEHRAIHDVSWSNLRIAALPGIEWCRTALEALQFTRSRLLPDRVARHELAAVAVAQPQLMKVRWYGASHAERIARWVFSRPPRVQTIYAVSSALADPVSANR